MKENWIGRKTDVELVGVPTEEAAGSPGAEEAEPGGGCPRGMAWCRATRKRPGRVNCLLSRLSRRVRAWTNVLTCLYARYWVGISLRPGGCVARWDLILLCTFFAIIYITNRYSAEQEMIEIEKLKTELTEVRYRALTRSSELTVKTRQSQIEKSLRQTPDSVLQSPKEPPFLIKSQNEEEE